MTWEERYQPLRDEWVVLAAHRQHRPWHGKHVAAGSAERPCHASDCYLCPGNERASGIVNPSYSGVFVFDNDHPCVGERAPEPAAAPSGGGGLNRVRRAQGACKVVCYSPRHDLTLARLSVLEISDLLRTLQTQCRALSAMPGVEHVLVFENKGEVVGVSNPHPHCQIYATSFVFKTIETELAAAERHLAKTGRVLFRDVIDAERQDGRRILAENTGALAFVPYFARYAYETFVAPKQTYQGLADVPDDELVLLADVLKQVLVRFDNLWCCEFPYVMALHQAPTRGLHPSFHFHIELHPPLRRPGLLKYLAGPEVGGGSFIADTAPEVTAAELLAVSSVHYRGR